MASPTEPSGGRAVGGAGPASPPTAWRRLGGTLRAHALPLLVAVVFLLPLYWMVTASLRQPGLPPPRAIEWLPDPIVPANYADVFGVLPFARYLLNSVLVVAVAVPVTVVVASMAGFAIAQLPRGPRSTLVVLSLALLMIPVTALWLTRFLLFRWIGFVDELAALVAPAFMGTSPLFVLLFYWTFRRLPSELIELARLEGAGPFSAWRRVGLPLAVPTSIAVAVLAFLFYWSDFIGPILYLRSPDLYTLPMGLRQLQQLDRQDWPLLMVGATLLAVPAILFFLVLQARFLAGVRLPEDVER
jgi:multiple sugar transport system permease protein